MLGWKPAERQVPGGGDLGNAVKVLEAEGFVTHVVNPEHAILKRDGTQWTVSGEKLPLEVAVAEADQGLYLQLRYDAFVAFDTGDLDELADELSSKLAAA